jgi:hypothetical protein
MNHMPYFKFLIESQLETSYFIQRDSYNELDLVSFLLNSTKVFAGLKLQSLPYSTEIWPVNIKIHNYTTCCLPITFGCKLPL